MVRPNYFINSLVVMAVPVTGGSESLKVRKFVTCLLRAFLSSDI